MSTLDFRTPAPQDQHGHPLLAEKTRHLRARIGEFLAAEIRQVDQERGVLSAVILLEEGHSLTTQQVAQQLSRRVGVEVGVEKEEILFYLTQDHDFADIDRLWGALFGILG